MRGPIKGVPALLQPVAHALLQAQEETARYLDGFEDRLLWERPDGMASVGFHLQHMAGVIDRLFTYAQDKNLTEEQFAYLRAEGEAAEGLLSSELVVAFGHQVQEALAKLREMDGTQLTEPRYLGRKRIPTTMMGLLFHAAEHVQRHVGQLLVTVRWVNA